ncbi:hypothetical protein DEO72_LG10g1814 [Vigna unguiculata]|uniref:Uncharacterized protein n=1 Tax=Vigna unguiculata TaxID=3917 RepID=A0A4D6NCW3_VIGUN|nr:hypothetical protein DEO72_LG10g1814 [Vigna unguiculata]
MDAQIPNIFVFVLRRREGVKPERFSCMEGNGPYSLPFPINRSPARVWFPLVRASSKAHLVSLRNPTLGAALFFGLRSQSVISLFPGKVHGGATPNGRNPVDPPRGSSWWCLIDKA